MSVTVRNLTRSKLSQSTSGRERSLQSKSTDDRVKRPGFRFQKKIQKGEGSLIFLLLRVFVIVFASVVNIMNIFCLLFFIYNF